MNAKEDVNKMMDDVLRKSIHAENFYEDYWDSEGIQVRKSRYEEGDYFEKRFAHSRDFSRE